MDNKWIYLLFIGLVFLILTLFLPKISMFTFLIAGIAMILGAFFSLENNIKNLEKDKLTLKDLLRVLVSYFLFMFSISLLFSAIFSMFHGSNMLIDANTNEQVKDVYRTLNFNLVTITTLGYGNI